MTDEKKKDKKEKKDGKDAKKIDDEQLKDVAGGSRFTRQSHDFAGLGTRDGGLAGREIISERIGDQ